MKAYLSIDLDYWNGRPSSEMSRFFGRVFRVGLPIMVACQHNHLLPHINSFQECNLLINVDYHSDIVEITHQDADGFSFNEGAWVNAVRWRQSSRYEWRPPDSRCLSRHAGYCHSRKDQNPLADPSVAGWMEAGYHLGLRWIPWGNLAAIGVALSPDWIDANVKSHPVIDRLGASKWLRASLSRFDWECLPPFLIRPRRRHK